MKSKGQQFREKSENFEKQKIDSYKTIPYAVDLFPPGSQWNLES